MAPERRRLGLVLMAGVIGDPGPAVQMVQEARQAAALDTLAAAEETGLFDRLVVVTNDPVWAGSLTFDCVVDLDDPESRFHFGRRLTQVVEYHRLSHVLYMGAGAAPLFRAADLAQIAETILLAERKVITNNLHSSDWAAFSPAGALSGLEDRVARDNSLAWVIHREAGLQVEALPPSAVTRLDIDTPTDLLVLSCHPACGSFLSAKLAELALDTSRLDQARAILTQEGKHIILGGRVASSTWAALERGTLCWVRLIAEERGMVASGRQERGEAHSLLGAYLDQVGMDAFFCTLEEWSDAVFLDDRVLLAHRGIWPSAEDRFASDLGWSDRVGEPFLRTLTVRANAASVPVILGGHSLVSGGLLALVEMTDERSADWRC